jgi:hypothetical protein
MLRVTSQQLIAICCSEAQCDTAMWLWAVSQRHVAVGCVSIAQNVVVTRQQLLLWLAGALLTQLGFILVCHT